MTVLCVDDVTPVMAVSVKDACMINNPNLILEQPAISALFNFNRSFCKK